MGLVDQDGREVDQDGCDWSFSPGVDIATVTVKHDEVEVFNRIGERVLHITKPSHPGAGLCVEVPRELMVT